MSDLGELLNHYFSLGVAEGKEGRDHDTPTGEAQATRDLIDIKISLAATEIKALRRENQELRAQIDAAREFVNRHPALSIIDIAEFEAFLKVPAIMEKAMSDIHREQLDRPDRKETT